jgi:hypothetical protein
MKKYLKLGFLTALLINFHWVFPIWASENSDVDQSRENINTSAAKRIIENKKQELQLLIAKLSGFVKMKGLKTNGEGQLIDIQNHIIYQDPLKDKNLSEQQTNQALIDMIHDRKRLHGVFEKLLQFEKLKTNNSNYLMDSNDNVICTIQNNHLVIITENGIEAEFSIDINALKSAINAYASTMGLAMRFDIDKSTAIKFLKIKYDISGETVTFYSDNNDVFLPQIPVGIIDAIKANSWLYDDIHGIRPEIYELDDSINEEIAGQNQIIQIDKADDQQEHNRHHDSNQLQDINNNKGNSGKKQNNKIEKDISAVEITGIVASVIILTGSGVAAYWYYSKESKQRQKEISEKNIEMQ